MEKQEKLNILLTKLTVFGENIRMLHWNAKGDEFGYVHDTLTNDLYEKLSDDVDRVAEIMIRLSCRPLNILEIVQVQQKNIEDIFIVNSNYLYDKDSVYKNIQKMLKSIMETIEEILELEVIQDVKNTGIRSDLEAMHNEYDIERRFKNARRLMK